MREAEKYLARVTHVDHWDSNHNLGRDDAIDRILEASIVRSVKRGEFRCGKEVLAGPQRF